MNKIITILSILLYTTATASDTTITVPKSAIAIQPFIATIKNDTAHSVTWKASNINRDTSLSATLFVYLLNKTGGRIYEYEINLPANIVAKWGFDNTLIDDYVFATNKLLKKK